MNFIDALQQIPMPILLISASDGVHSTCMTAAWFMPVSINPPLVAVAIAPQRYTFELLMRSKEFAIMSVPRSLVKEAIEIFGTLSGRSINKFKLAKVEVIKARSISAPIIKDMPLVMECKLVQASSTGDHYIIVGRVIEAYSLGKGEPIIYFRREPYTIGNKVDY